MTNSTNSSSDSNFLQQINDDMAAAIDEARRSLVQVHVGQGNGAGTIWHPDGLIITNAHVVASEEFRQQRRGPRYGYWGSHEGQQALTVTLPDGRSLPAKVIARDNERDVAAIAVEASDLPTIRLGDSRKLKAGNWVFAIGHPWGVTGAASAGIVVGTGADLPEVLSNREWIAVDLRVRPGNSGGPLIDAKGRLVGINTLMTGPQIGAAVPVHVITEFLQQTVGTQAVATPV